jgi:membrane-associated phospholipid phosphatase
MQVRRARSLNIPSDRLPEVVPVALTSAMLLLSLIWNLHVGISWRPPLVLALTVPMALLAASLLYLRIRRAPRAAEILLYMCLWMAVPIIGVRLSYLGFSLDFPLQDSVFLDADHQLGLDWRTWARFSAAHPWFWQAQRIAYQSHLLQPIIAVVAMAFWRPREANAQLFVALVISLMATLVTAALLPSIGPAAVYGLEPSTTATISMLRSAPYAQALPYSGIVQFPSFHAVLEILFAYACRGYRLLFSAALAFGLIVVLSTPLCGNHYFVDILGGAVVAALGIGVARFIVPIRSGNMPAEGAVDAVPG